MLGYMRGNTSTRQRSFRPSYPSTYVPPDAQHAGGIQPSPRAARISRRPDHPGISTPLLEMLALLIQISFLNTILQSFFINQSQLLRGTNPSYSSSLRITLGEWRPCPSSSFHPSKLPLRTCAARSAGDEPHSPRAAPNLGFTLGE